VRILLVVGAVGPAATAVAAAAVGVGDGPAYAAWLAEQFPDVGGKSDDVAYWFHKAHDHLPPGGRAGLVGTTAIRTGDTRTAALDYLIDHGGVIYDAVASQPWSGEAVVRVSIVNWCKGSVPGADGSGWLMGRSLSRSRRSTDRCRRRPTCDPLSRL
jgi:hypothetical protein